MGEISDLARDIYRDFQVEGVPASGEHDPEKARIRGLHGIIDQRVSAAAASLTDYETLAALEVSEQTAGLAFVTRNNGSATDPANGVYQPDGFGGWEKADWYFDSVTSVVQPIIDAGVAASEVERAAAEAAAAEAAREADRAGDVVASSAQDTPTSLVHRSVGTNYQTSTALAGVALGMKVGGAYLAASGIITGVRLALQRAAALDHLIVKAWKRPSTTPGGDIDKDPGEPVTDVQLWNQTIPAASLQLMAGDNAPRGADLLFASPIDLDTAFDVNDILIITVSAYNVSNADTALGFGVNVPGATLPAHERGWYSAVGTGTNWTALPSNQAPALTLLGRDVSLAPVLQKLDDRSQATAEALTIADSLLIQRPGIGGYGLGSAFAGFAVAFTGADIAAGTAYDGIGFDLAVGTGAATVIVSLYRRSADFSAAQEPGVVTDILLERRTYTVAELGLTPAAAPLIPVRHLFDGGWATPATGFDLVTIEARKADGSAALMDFNRAIQSGWATERKGWYRPLATSGAWASLGSFANAFSLLREGYAAPSVSEDRIPVGFDLIQSVSASAVGNVVSIAVDMKRLGQVIRASAALTVTLPSAAVVTGEAATISRASNLAFGTVPVAARLDYPGVTALSIAGLTEGVDYEVNYDLGAIRHLTADNVDVSVNYTGSQMAVDAVVLNRSTLALSIVQGPLRGRDALEKRAEPASPEQVVVAWVVRTQRGLRVAPVYLGDDVLRLRAEKNRRILARLKGKMARQAAINWAAYGDSITQMGGNPDTVATAGTPNGSRDLGVSYLNPTGDGIQSDITSALPLYTAVQMGMPDDGLGQTHTKIGMNWRAIEAVETVYGCTVNYFNMGIGGTGTSNSISGVRPNGAYPARLAALNAVCPAGTMDVCVIGFGMNQPDSTGTDNDLVTIANAIRAVHPNVTLIFCAPAKPNETFRAGSEWLLQSRQIEWAADHVGAAFIDLAAVWGAGDKPGLLGIPTGFECSTTFVNHPGLKELDAMGYILAFALLP